jgi:predicted nucleic acid-binding protein
MEIYVDATTIISLGNAGRLDLLNAFDGTVVVPDAVASEVTTEPANSNLRAFLDDGNAEESNAPGVSDATPEATAEAMDLLDEDDENGDVVLIASVIRHRRRGDGVAIVSDDRRVRRVAEGLGAEVTGTIGVVVRAVAEGRLDEPAGLALVERLDERGLHTTAELRTRTEELVRRAARDEE